MDMHSFEGPATWDEVDMQDLDKVMLRVTSAAMPSTDNKELASRLAMQSAAHEAENSDPLGLGQIDSRQINLVRLCLRDFLLRSACSEPDCLTLNRKILTGRL